MQHNMISYLSYVIMLLGYEKIIGFANKTMIFETHIPLDGCLVCQNSKTINKYYNKCKVFVAKFKYKRGHTLTNLTST